MQFVDDGGVITVDVEAGDVMIIRGAEHRFRALTPAAWVLHFAGPEAADLVATHTGRPGHSMGLGLDVRLSRLFSHTSGNLFGIAVDHFVGYGNVREGGLSNLPELSLDASAPVPTR